MSTSYEPQRYGSFLSDIPESQEYLTLSFSPSLSPRQKRWRNYGLSADFLGDYFATFFPGQECGTSKINRRDTVKGTVSYIANELLENAVKYSAQDIDLPISITLYLYQQEIILKVINHASVESVSRYQSFIQDLLQWDIDTLYTSQLEKTALGAIESSMGILTMVNDYAAKFGWEFQRLASYPNVMRVIVCVQLDM